MRNCHQLLLGLSALLQRRYVNPPIPQGGNTSDHPGKRLRPDSSLRNSTWATPGNHISHRCNGTCIPQHSIFYSLAGARAMRLESIQLRNFRGIEDIIVHFDSSLTVVVGENGAGKTSLLDATSLGLLVFAHFGPKIPSARTMPQQLKLLISQSPNPHFPSLYTYRMVWCNLSERLFRSNWEVIENSTQIPSVDYLELVSLSGKSRLLPSHCLFTIAKPVASMLEIIVRIARICPVSFQ